MGDVTPGRENNTSKGTEAGMASLLRKKQSVRLDGAIVLREDGMALR